MADWEFAQRDAAEQLARVEHFSFTKKHSGGDVEVLITVHEYITPKDPAMKFVARADKEFNQKGGGFQPCGWGTSLLQALSACLELMRKFPYEG
ncbi:MAG TPA: hypothetical protein VM120_12955 [Bryobacteraceae bacterium]|nr:hypothetical protein [Bryobacteraceae bacterium]